MLVVNLVFHNNFRKLQMQTPNTNMKISFYLSLACTFTIHKWILFILENYININANANNLDVKWICVIFTLISESAISFMISRNQSNEPCSRVTQ